MPNMHLLNAVECVKHSRSAQLDVQCKINMISKQRFKSALAASSIHFIGSLIVAALAAALVFGLWYPYPYRDFSGGRELFLLVVAVDVVCGPLLTAVLFNLAKPRAELWRDLGLVALIQLAALGYGLHSVWLARPLFLVMEVDRFKVVVAPDVEGVSAALRGLPVDLQPRLWSGPKTVAIREPKDAQERKIVMFESVQGGRDYALRPEFYIPYEGAAAAKSLTRAKPLDKFLVKYPEQKSAAQALAIQKGVDLAQWQYVPVIARQDWIAILGKQGQIEGYLKGDGF
jgi:hypothetical protein